MKPADVEAAVKAAEKVAPSGKAGAGSGKSAAPANGVKVEPKLKTGPVTRPTVPMTPPADKGAPIKGRDGKTVVPAAPQAPETITPSDKKSVPPSGKDESNK